MAFLKYANASVQKFDLTRGEWDSICASSVSPAPDFKHRGAAKVLIQEYDPKRYLLSHCTIIASVDTELVSAPLGRHMVDGFQIDRRYNDFYITPGTSQFVNNNFDAWERKLLLASFKTFIGAENYVEHIQIPELSKGKIIDAAARNIGDSIYIDILVATGRQHAPLVKAIQSGELGTLSMGCSVTATTCTKCGNVAEDETKLCPHIRWFKGSDFIDEMGKKRKIAELCGHISAEPGSVKFIEASWVANPAFKGAVIRNILSPEEISGSVGQQLQAAFAEPPRVGDPNLFQRAARVQSSSLSKYAQDQFEGVSDFENTQAPKPEKDPLNKAVGDLAGLLKDKAIEHVRQEINRDEASKVRRVIDENQNDTLIKSALRYPEWRQIARHVFAITRDITNAKHLLHGLVLHKNGGWAAVKKSGNFTGRGMLGVSRLLDLLQKKSSVAGEARIYRTVISVGGTGPYRDVEAYLSACRHILGRQLTGTEAGALLEKGRLFALGSS